LEIPVSLKYSLWKALDAENERNETIVAVGFRFWLIERLELSLGVSFAGINRPKDILDETYFDPTLSSQSPSAVELAGKSSITSTSM